HLPPPTSDAAIRWMLLLRNPFVHTSVMMRRAVLTAHHLRYDDALPLSQDIELWPRVLAVARGANLAAPLVRHRLHDQRVSARRGDEQQAVGYAIRQRGLEALLPGCVASPEAVKRLQTLSYVVPEAPDAAVLAEAALLLRLFRAQRDGSGAAGLAPRPDEALAVERALVDHLLHVLQKAGWKDGLNASLPRELLIHHPAALANRVAGRGAAWLRRRLIA
ncbi:MAG: hypothetical protein HQL51_13635, partial [Magnetococcales bacterium]|nr:hypothetical protein [Magnetococcales bacterium]